MTYRCATSTVPVLMAVGLLSLGAPGFAQGPTITCDSDPSLFNTAYDGAGGSLPPGGVDMAWEVGAGTPDGGPGSVGTYIPAFVVGQVVPAWTPSPFDNADWISFFDDATHPGQVDHYYRYLFTLASEVDPTTFSLGMDFYVDNSVWEVYINGQPQSGDPSVGTLPQAPDDPYFHNGFGEGNQASLTLASGWQAGDNELVIQTRSAAPRVGLMGQMTPGALCPNATPAISLDKTGSGPDPLQVGDTVDYSFVVTDTGDIALANVTVTDPLPGMSPIDCPSDTLAPGAEMTCTSTYTVTQEDVETGFIENTATVTGEPPDGPPVSAEDFAVVPPSQKPGISIEKSGSGPDPLEVGATIDYTFLVTNTGNITLSDVTVTDPLPGLSPISCPDTTLLPGAEMTCTATYTVTQEDVDAGAVENTATVTGQPPGDLPPPTDESTTTVPPTQTSGVSIEKSGSGPDPLTVGATIDYSFVVTNTGNVTLTNVEVTDPLPGLSPIDCPDTTLAPGAEMTCTATYEVTQTDVDAGVVENTATVTGETPTGGPPPTDESTTTVPPAEPVPALPPLAFVLLVALLATATLWTLRRARA